MGGRFGKYGDLKRRQALLKHSKAASRQTRGNAQSRGKQGRAVHGKHPLSSSKFGKTHKTALVAIPPEILWESIQGIRKQYDPHHGRWMPHITLIYPFVPVARIHQAVAVLTRACHSVEPFEVRLARFHRFIHSRHRATIYLVPEPVDAIKSLQRSLMKVLPDYNEVTRFVGGFNPHLSVGQVNGRKAQEVCNRWQATWQPLEFILTQVCVIRRNDPPDDRFRVSAVISLDG